MRRAGICVVATIVCVLLSGCVTTAGGTLGSITRATESAASDLRSARLAFASHRDDRSTSAVTETALSDALSAVNNLESEVAEQDVATNQERRARAAALKAIQRGADAIIRAKETLAEVGGGGTTRAALTGLTKASERLTELAKQLRSMW